MRREVYPEAYHGNNRDKRKRSHGGHPLQLDARQFVLRQVGVDGFHPAQIAVRKMCEHQLGADEHGKSRSRDRRRRPM